MVAPILGQPSSLFLSFFPSFPSFGSHFLFFFSFFLLGLLSIRLTITPANGKTQHRVRQQRTRLSLALPSLVLALPSPELLHLQALRLKNGVRILLVD
ncbi:hypothetical protein BDV26DRAFT_264164 [Aspergillus bertholletiae]|uniref:Uncharacterized protein n=1 Tax=Aspergillus bertholletiae TaxID=1226010 RepID=A0A5N7B6V0_9EURO|nr:hypothetical protein BDV26DRAFT_264164 [Aspergillus bertholletiae]